MRSRRTPRLTDKAHVELVRSLFVTLTPTLIMSILFIVVAAMAVGTHPDRILATLGVLGGAASLVRIGVVLVCERWVNDADLGSAKAVLTERLFGASYLAFAGLLGAFAARAMHVCEAEVQSVVAALVVGYAAGVAAGASLRPWISVPAVLVAVLPPALDAATGGDVVRHLLGFVLLALLAGGIGSMLRRYRSEVEKITLRHSFASLARTDHLTGLLNRFALGEAFARAIDARGDGGVAIHCIDLDRFKPVNDAFGHPTGDKLLVEVADRLRGLCRPGDVAARLGGDEFALLQTGIGHADEASLLARRIVRALVEPYFIGNHRIAVGASVGSAGASGRDLTLDDLLDSADRALYRAKRDGGSAATLAPAERDLSAATG